MLNGAPDDNATGQSEARSTYSYWNNQYLLAVLGMPLIGGLVVFWAFKAEVVGGGGVWFRPLIFLAGLYFIIGGALRAINPREFEILGEQVRATYLTGRVREWGLASLLVRPRRLRWLLGGSAVVEERSSRKVVFRVFDELPDREELLDAIGGRVA